MKIIEIPELPRLEKRVAETAAVVTDWKRSVAAIQTELNTANAALMRAKNQRETHAMAARLGDATAAAAVKSARGEQYVAEQDIVDLQLALPEAQAKLATAERNAESARRELAQHHAQQLQRSRIEVAGQIDAVIADFTRLLNEYEKLGHAIANADALPRNLHGMSDHEGCIGLRRVRAALPKFLDKVYPNSLHDENLKENLATTEARHWNLAPEQSETKAA
jgi:chromosome segregation ATPase